MNVHRAASIFALALLAVAGLWAAQNKSEPARPKPKPFSKAVLIEPADLANQLKQPGAQRPIVLQVGFPNLYEQGHIPGSLHAGPCSKTQGLADLQQAAAGMARGREVVIYCGCCPMSRCPNVHPAYEALKRMGFERVRVLNVRHTFVQDWTKKGLPTATGKTP